MRPSNTSSRSLQKPKLLSKASSIAILREPLVSSPRERDSIAESVQSAATVKAPETSSVAVDISLRRGRIALITVACVAVIVAIVRFFRTGYELRQYEKTDLDVAEQKRILDDYNSYSGNIVSAFSKPIEIFIAACAQVIVLRFVSGSLLRNEPSWKAVYGALALSAGVGYLINNGFNSLNVQLVDLAVNSAVKLTDLSVTESTIPTYVDGTSRVTNVSWSVSESQSRNPITNTVMLNVVQSQAVRPKTACPVVGYNRFRKLIALDNVEYGFPQRDWMKQLLPEALPATSLRFLLNPTNKSANAGVESKNLPMNASIASNLVLHAMILSLDFIPMARSLRDPTYNADGDSEANVSTAVRVGLLPRNYESTTDLDQKKWFINRLSPFLTTAFNSTVNMTLTNIPMEFSHVDVAPKITFDAVNFEIDVSPALLADVTNNKTGERYMGEGTEYAFFRENSFTCGPWPARCLFKKKDPLMDDGLLIAATDLYYDAPAQIKAFAICLNDNGVELMQSSGRAGELGVLPCNRTSTTSMLVVTVGKRIVADALDGNSTVNTTGVYPDRSTYAGRASATNLRKIYSFTVGRLTWATVDIADEFGATCEVVSGSKCEGLSVELNSTSTNSTPQRLVVSADAIPVDSLLQPQLNNLELDKSYRQRPLTLVQVHEPTRQLNAESWYDAVAGDILLPHNVRALKWNQTEKYVTGMCDVTEERIQRVLDNHMYIEHPLQATYTAATFFLFQNAVVKDVLASNDQSPLSTAMLAFDGNTQKVSLSVSIPSMNAFLTQIGCGILLVGVAASILWATIIRNSTSRPNELVGITNAEVMVRAKLDQGTFPPLLLHRHVTLANGSTVERQKLDDYMIDTLTLQQRGQQPGRPTTDDDDSSVV